MEILNLTQGSPEWLATRAKAFTASEAPAMMGTSPYMTRSELLRMKHSGIASDVDSATQRRFDAGHDAEAAARPLAESYLQEELYPATVAETVEGLYLLASLDGMTMGGDILWECKLWSQKIEAMIEACEIADSHWPQLEHQLLVTNAQRVYFTGCDGAAIKGQLWYDSKPERRAALIAGWKQFAADLAAYVPQEVLPAAVAAPINELPALMVEITGSVVASNLAQWKDVVTARIADISTNLQSDTDFATAESTVKFLEDGEKRIDLVKAQAQAQAIDIDAVFRAMDEIKATMRSKRLELDKMVKARKESIRTEIVLTASKALQAHIDSLNARIGWNYMPVCYGDFAGAIKGKRTIQSLRDACDTELANCKIETSATADRIELNLKGMAALCNGTDYRFLFPGLAQLVLKAPDDFAAVVSMRINEHKAAEEKRIEAEREKIRAEEEQKATAKAKAEQEEAERQRKAQEAIESLAQINANNVAASAALAKTAPSEHATNTPPAPLPESGAPVAAIQPRQQPVADSGATLKLGEINARLAPLSVDAAALKALGFEPAGNQGAAKLYLASDFPRICMAIIRHVDAVMPMQRAA